MRREVVVVITCLWAMRTAHHSIVGRLMVPVVFEVIGHLVGCSRDPVAADVEDLAVGGGDSAEARQNSSNRAWGNGLFRLEGGVCN